MQRKLLLGNLNAKRDWGYAKDYVQSMWLMLQQPHPDDYVVATGRTVSVQEFLSIVFDRLGMDWRRYVELDPRFLRPVWTCWLASPSLSSVGLAGHHFFGGISRVDG